MPANKQDFIHRRLVWAMLIGLLGMALSACAGLAGEPEIIATIAPASPTAPLPTDVGYPVENPDIANGAQIYALNCTSCHGEMGDGQGELVLSGDVGAMPSFLDVEHVRNYRPDEYFDIITNGNLENLMPPWREALSEQERWDVTMYVYTMAYSEESIANGQQIYVNECARCHGDDGRSDGVDMVETGREAFDYQDWQTMSILSDGAMYYSIADGIGESMPAFAPDLSDSDIYDAVAYTRQLALQQDTPAPTATEDASVNNDTQSNTLNNAQGTASITGQVINESVGGDVPERMRIFLRYGNLEDGIGVLETNIDAENRYRFDGVPVVDNYEYVAVARYQDINFPSDFVQGENLGTGADLPITIYERTEDPFSISISAIDTTISTFTVEDVGTGLLFEQMVTYQNESDRVYLTTQSAGSGRLAALLWQLPPGVIILNDPANPRYLLAREQYAIVDTAPVFPGEHQLEAIYFMPYDGGAIIDQPMSNPLDGRVGISLVPQNLRIQSDAIVVGDAPNSDGSQNYQGRLALARGESLVYDIQGDLFLRADEANSVVTGNNLLVIVLVVALVVVGGAVFIFWRNSKGDDAQVNQLIRQIADLDALHEQGSINHDAYQQERQALKAKLSAYLEKTRPESEA
jgi:mono/diheme cytochrome c family protein